MLFLYSTLSLAGASNLFRLKATEREYSEGGGHIVNFSLMQRGGAQHQHFSNYFIPKLNESLHYQVPIAAYILLCV